MSGSAATQDVILENGRFQIDIPGIASSKMAMRWEIDPFTVDMTQVTSGDNAGYVQLKPGAAKFGTATFHFHVDMATQNADLQTWVNSVTTGGSGQQSSVLRKNITINCYDRKKNLARSFTLNDAFPIHFDRGDMALDSKTLECKLVVQIGYVTFT